MGKKDIFGAKVLKEVRKRIQAELQEGKSRQQLLEELSLEYMDKSRLAYLIATILPPEDMLFFTRKNKTLYYLMVSFSAYILTLKLLFLLSIDWNKKWFLLPVALIQPAFIFYFAYLIKKAEGFVYTLVILLGLVGLIQSIHKDMFANMTNVVFFLINVLWIISGMILANSISKQYFPHLRWKMPSPDKDGNYILSRKEMRK